MAVRRVVTGNTDGRSSVISDDLTHTTWCEEIWMTDADNPDGVDPGSKMRPVEPPTGSTTFRIVSILPKAALLSLLADPDANTDDLLDSEGFHVTDTVDYVFVLDGPVELMLDADSVVLEAGDCVIQRRTKHAWHNHNDHPVRLLSVMVR